MAFPGFPNEHLSALDLPVWQKKFRDDVLGVPCATTTLDLGEFSYQENPELQALFLSYIADKTQLFDTFEAFKKRFKQSAVAPRKPRREPERSRLRSSRKEFVAESVHYHLRESEYQKRLVEYQQAQDALDLIKGQYSPDEEGYARAVLDALTPEQRDFFSSSKTFSIVEQRRRRHSYVCGGTGSGKSEMLKRLLHHYLNDDPSSALVVIDPHGELSYQIAKFAENANNDRLVLVDPSLSKSDGMTPIFNPFDLPEAPSPEDLSIFTEELMAAFRSTMDDEAGFSLQMEVVLKPCIAALLLMPDGHIGHLQQFMDAGENGALKDFAIRNLPNAQQVQFLRRQFDKPNYVVTRQSIYTKVQSFLNSQVFLNFLVGRSTFDLETEIEARKLIIFNLSRSSAGAETSSAMGRLILARLIGIAMQRATLSELDLGTKTPIHVFIDEAQHYVTPAVCQILTEARKFKLYLTLANQFLDQITDRQVRSAIEGNTEVKLVGRQTDPKGVSNLAKLTGADPKVLTSLPVGRFFAKIGELGGFTVQNQSDLVDFKGAMSSARWDVVRQQQIERYYRAVKSSDEMAELLDSRSSLAVQKSIPKKPKRTLE